MGGLSRYVKTDKALVGKATRRLNPVSVSSPIPPRFGRPFRNTLDPTNTKDPNFPPIAHPEDKHFQVSPEVKEALSSGKPIVALETTIYTHGFPYPDNVALALDLESIVRRNGGVPATIGILDGVAKVGMTTEELRRITAAAANTETMKVSRRDLPYILGLVSPLSSSSFIWEKGMLPSVALVSPRDQC
jgi:hypothetical protein